MCQLRALKVRDLFFIGCTATFTVVIDCNLAPFGSSEPDPPAHNTEYDRQTDKFRGCPHSQKLQNM